MKNLISHIIFIALLFSVVVSCEKDEPTPDELNENSTIRYIKNTNGNDGFANYTYNSVNRLIKIENGILKLGFFDMEEIIEGGTWKYDKNQNAIFMSSTVDKNMNGKAEILKLTKDELQYKKEFVNWSALYLDANYKLTEIENIGGLYAIG